MSSAIDSERGTALTGERSDNKVAAVFATEEAARSVAEGLRTDGGLQPEQVLVVTPRDEHPGRKLQPESRGILHTIILSHYKLAIAGIVLGLLVVAVLYFMDVGAVTRSPAFAAFAAVFFGVSFGLFAGGLISLRPDQDPMVFKVREALDKGRSAVVVHAFSAEQRDLAAQALERNGGETIRTL
ncbi:MAG: hypothetical protein Q4F49_08820 [Pseudoxanthomonas suwonensis]|nr:hypothetical protein [Pseudoxanthomonas suwonensis]